MDYVYIESERGLWTVGFYKPNGEFEPESDWDKTEDAAKRVNYLNGGASYLDFIAEINTLREMVKDLADIVNSK